MLKTVKELNSLLVKRIRFIHSLNNLKQSYNMTDNIQINASIGCVSEVDRSVLLNQKEDSGILLPPRSVRGMTVLDKSMFCKTIVVPWLAINNVNVGQVMKNLKKYLLKMMNLKPLQPLEMNLESSHLINSTVEDVGKVSHLKKKVLLNPLLVSSYSDMDDSDLIVLQRSGVCENDFDISKVTLNYDNWRADEILKAVLPEDKDCLTSYSIIGHIVHVNLREHLLPYKHIIGQVLLDKVNGARTIVNKTDTIDNTYRNFKMELLCGENDMITQVRESYCKFELNFSSVYWNPRLSTEHERIVSKLKKGDVLYDVFAGVGPFAIPAAKKKCSVLANDLNPESHKWLQHNGKLNKVSAFLRAFNKDGKEFIREDVKTDILQKWQSEDFTGSIHITMNLPALAYSFLHVFIGLFTSEELTVVKNNNFPIVHVYCFTKGDKPELLARQIVEENLQVGLGNDILELVQVRNVSPNKEMMRVSFVLSKEVLEGSLNCKMPCLDNTNAAALPEQPPHKKICISLHGLDGKTEEQQQGKTEQCVQGSRSKEFEDETQGESSLGST